MGASRQSWTSHPGFCVIDGVLSVDFLVYDLEASAQGVTRPPETYVNVTHKGRAWNEPLVALLSHQLLEFGFGQITF